MNLFSKFTGYALIIQALFACFFALGGDWRWFAVAMVGWFLILVLGVDES